ncbi:uncharacterized protein SPPG_03222 [Spizellomyces punctatus DAOM BR117]|uniref:N-acetyltransferase domain-containing protein n=1 Tax=Spizellomyces punctatus (strain DAOM BR117) TaxID=645134 RepID=A0A0L0HIX8_SPIPD|nr:uncharacterized protein SPPG_03222 [Spizellomyces punctatus DAOM BR117]KND01416.1 hypothetical protein SPPG_03222 [Spizellomyces punctatus DAOM BR117]|eukprot:XP_016609455.1 hypothetical protein SPPG_03222 [Spizellomyces punctatus DAOM BR117]
MAAHSSTLPALRTDGVRIELVDPRNAASYEAGLAELLIDCVDGGSSVGFLAGLTHHAAVDWWHKQLQNPNILTWVAVNSEGQILGTVGLALAPQANGRHRAEVCKLLVHRNGRGHGYASALMSALEEEARKRCRTVLVLDTVTGSTAEHIYLRWGWQRVGVIEDFAALPDGRLWATTVFTKKL